MPPIARNLVDTDAVAAVTTMDFVMDQFTAVALDSPLPVKDWSHADIGNVGVSGEASFLDGRQIQRRSHRGQRTSGKTPMRFISASTRARTATAGIDRARPPPCNTPTRGRRPASCSAKTIPPARNTSCSHSQARAARCCNHDHGQMPERSPPMARRQPPQWLKTVAHRQYFPTLHFRKRHELDFPPAASQIRWAKTFSPAWRSPRTTTPC